MKHKCLEHLCPVIMSHEVYHTLFYDQYGAATTLIQHGHPRPEEKELKDLVQEWAVTTSTVRYLKQLGVPVVYACSETVEVFPELLDMLKESYVKDSPIPQDPDIITDPYIHVTDDLLKEAAILRPDLIDVIRKVVIQDFLADLFAHFKIKFEELDTSRLISLIENGSAKKISRLVKDLDAPEELFYPLVCRAGNYEVRRTFFGPKFEKYVIDHWEELSLDCRDSMAKVLPKKYAITTLQESLNRNPSVWRIDYVSKMYTPVFPEMKGVRTKEEFRNAIEAIRLRYE